MNEQWLARGNSRSVQESQDMLQRPGATLTASKPYPLIVGDVREQSNELFFTAWCVKNQM